MVAPSARKVDNGMLRGSLSLNFTLPPDDLFQVALKSLTGYPSWTVRRINRSARVVVAQTQRRPPLNFGRIVKIQVTETDASSQPFQSVCTVSSHPAFWITAVLASSSEIEQDVFHLMNTVVELASRRR